MTARVRDLVSAIVDAHGALSTALREYGNANPATATGSKKLAPAALHAALARELALETETRSPALPFVFDPERLEMRLAVLTRLRGSLSTSLTRFQTTLADRIGLLRALRI